MSSVKGIALATVEFQAKGRLNPLQVMTAKQMMLNHLETGNSVTELA